MKYWTLNCNVFVAMKLADSEGLTCIPEIRLLGTAALLYEDIHVSTHSLSLIHCCRAITKKIQLYLFVTNCFTLSFDKNKNDNVKPSYCVDRPIFTRVARKLRRCSVRWTTHLLPYLKAIYSSTSRCVKPISRSVFGFMEPTISDTEIESIRIAARSRERVDRRY